MAQWDKIAQLSKSETNISRQIISLLEHCQIPINIRQIFAGWIEEQPWAEFENEEHENQCEPNVLKELLSKISQREQAPGGDVAEIALLADGRRKLIVIIRNNCTIHCNKCVYLQDTYGTSSRFFAKNMKHCLESERLVIESLNQDPDMKRKRPIKSNIAVEDPQIQQRIAMMQEKISGLDAMIRNLDHCQEVSHLNLQELTEKKVSAEREGNQIIADQLVSKIRDITVRIYNERKELCEQCLVPLASEVAHLVLSIWEEIADFKQKQKLSITCLDKPKEGAIEILDKHCESGSVFMINLLRALENTQMIFRKNTFNDDPPLKLLQKVIEELNSYIKEHINRCFIVCKDVPNQILKVGGGKTTAFRMSVRLLGGCGLNPSASPIVSATLYSEKDLALLEDANHKGGPPKPMGVVSNGKDKSMEKRPMVANFTALRLEKVNRPDKGRNEDLVTSYKYGIMFRTSINVMNNTHNIKATSLPLVLVSQTSQDCMAKGTLIWDAAFSKPTRLPFEVASEVEWTGVKAVLNALWKEHTGRGLDENHFLFIARLIFKDPLRTNFENQMITEKQLIRDKMPSSQGFSFWKWNWAYMNLCRDHIKREWQDGLVCGFISKQDAKERLQNEPVGSFLIRFSESSIESCQKADFYGYLTVAVLEVDPVTTKNRVFFLKDHLTPEDLAKYDLVMILNAFEVEDFMNPGVMKRLLNGLYPNVTIPFEERFHSYLANKRESLKDSGYVHASLKLEISLTDDKTRARRESFNPMSPSVSSMNSYNPQSPLSAVSMDNPGTPQGVGMLTGSPIGSRDLDSQNSFTERPMVSQMLTTDLPEFGTIDSNLLQFGNSFMQQGADNGIVQELSNMGIEGFVNSQDDMGQLIGAHGQESMDGGRTFRRL
ncbi:hypothetical protein CAPTEDRAFT_215693 [Capitella teleta]|uniref:Signal transducer and activator of transcription n=1 Tax=Capitella teleta TaxID=283909 RepID=R7TJC3_CAPTE|nr:hypothetical protein CAPTEDRAFT_215693 [Capitella teleta]|eukprot:ELT93908.1 hypothetical protein CAPTEDRAFT_215693 [Capitella teleta]